jgi:hypothetical protein
MKGSSQTGTGRLILNAGDLITLMIFESGKAPFWKEFRAEELMKRLAGKPETFLEILPFPKDGLNTASLRIQDFGKEIPAGYREGTFCPPRFLQAKSSGSGPLFFPFYQRGKFGPGSGKAGVKLENLLHGQIRNRKDLEAKAEVEVNAEGIGLHFFITDDSLINEAPLPWDKGPVESVYIPTPADDDAVEIFFDVRKEGNPYYGAGVFHFAFKAGDENLWLDNRLQTDTRGIRNRYIPTSNGYERQLFFLWSSLGLSTKPSTGFHFNLNVSDDDNGRARDKTLSLFPAHGYGWADAMEMGEMDLR